MGYYTRFKLSVKSPIEQTLTEESIIHDFREKCEDANYALNDEGNPQEPCKWYDSEEDLKEFSKSYPEHLFTLEGNGEEAGDMWKLYVKNGKCQREEAQIVFNEFDERFLQ